MDSDLRVMIVAGETSGDEHAARLVEKLREYHPHVTVFGMGGSQLRKAGMDVIIDCEESGSVMGLTEVFGSLQGLVAAYKTLLRKAEERRPHLAILLDFPDFNMRFAKAIHKQGIKVLYYISPQLWAWRKKRVHQIKKYVSKVATIFPFEEAFYHSHGVDAEYVGHPFLDRKEVLIDRAEYLSRLGVSAERPVIGILPGSRKSEIEQMLLPMVDGFRRVQKGRPGVQALIPVAPAIDIPWVQSLIGGQKDIYCVSGQAVEVLHVADTAVVTSGTATVEAALAGVPFLVVYKFSPATYRVARLLVRGVRNFAMANLIAGSKIVEELLQDEVTPGRIAIELERFLGSRIEREKCKERLKLVRERLMYGTDSSETAAERVAKMVLALSGFGGDNQGKPTWRETKPEGRVTLRV